MYVDTTMPIVRPNANCFKDWDGRTWVFEEDWYIRYTSNKLDFTLLMSEGVTTDFGSVPSFWWVRVNPYGKGIIGFLPHDGLYMTEAFTRSINDWILLEILGTKDAGFGWSKRNSIWSAVKVGGGYVYDNHTKESINSAREKIALYVKASDYKEIKTGFQWDSVLNNDIK